MCVCIYCMYIYIYIYIYIYTYIHTYILKNKTFIAAFINCLPITINVGTMLYRGWTDYLLMIHSVQLLQFKLSQIKGHPLQKSEWYCDASWYHHREAQNHSPEHSLSPFLAGGMIFPPPSGMLDPCQFSSNN